MTRKFYAAFALLACLLFLAAGAYAEPVCLGVSNNGGATITTVSSISPGNCVQGFNSYGGADPQSSLWTISMNGTAAPDLLPEPGLDSDTLDVTSSGGAGILNIYVTAEQENLSPEPLGLVSTLESNTLPAGWTVTETVYVAPCSATPSVCTSGAGDGRAVPDDIRSEPDHLHLHRDGGTSEPFTSF